MNNVQEAAQILLQVLRLGRSREALEARAAFAEHRAIALNKKANGIVAGKKTKKAKTNRLARRRRRVLNRAFWWKRHAETLRERVAS